MVDFFNPAGRDVSGAIFRGLEFKAKREAAKAGQAKQAEFQELLGQAFPGQQPAQSATPDQTGFAQQVPGLQVPADVTPITPQQGIQTQAQPTQDQALSRLATQFPEQFEAINKNLGLISTQQKSEAADFAFKLKNTPFEQRSAIIQQRSITLESQGRDASDTRELEGQTEAQQNQSARVIQVATLSPEKRLELAQGPKPTTLQKNLIAAGLQPGTPEFQSAVLEAITRPTTQVTIGGAGKEQEELAKLRAQDLKSIRARGDQSEVELGSLDILESIDVKTGSFEPAKQSLASFAEGLGVDASALADVASGQAFTAESGKLVLRIIERQKGPQTDDDRRQIAKTIARLGNRPEANTFISSTARSIARRNIEQRDFFNNFLDQNDTLKGASKSWNDFKRGVPMVSRNVRTPEGLPVFFFRFKDRVKAANPEASDAQIIQAWKDQEAAGAK